MRDWEVKWPQARPRWGTFSVQAHLDLRRLATDVLPGLRAIWSKEYQEHVRDFPNDPTLAFDLTAAITAELSFAQLVGLEDDRLGHVAADPPKIHPAFAAQDVRARLQAGGAKFELVAAFQGVRQARRIAGAVGDDKTLPLYPLPDEGVRLRLELAAPEGVDEATFHRVLDVVGDDDFRAARRRLWSWEEQVSADNLDDAAAQLSLEGLIRDYNAAVARHAKQTRLQTVFLLVPAALGAAIDAATGGGWVSTAGGLGVGFVADRVKAKFPMLAEAGAAVSHHPGSTVSGAVSVLAHD